MNSRLAPQRQMSYIQEHLKILPTLGTVQSVILDTSVYTFDYSLLPGSGSTILRSKHKGAAFSVATLPASARGAAAVDTKHPPLAERNHPRTVTILQSLNESNIYQGGCRYLVWHVTITLLLNKNGEGGRNALDNHCHRRSSSGERPNVPPPPVEGPALLRRDT